VVDKKPLVWFLAMTFIISWPLFLIGAPNYWALAMWGPGIAAILTTVFVVRRGWREGLKELGLGRFGKFRFYLLA
jgi:hypothetical protein